MCRKHCRHVDCAVIVLVGVGCVGCFHCGSRWVNGVLVDGLGVGVGCVGVGRVGLVQCGSRWVNGVLVDGLGVGVGCVGLVHCGSRWVNGVLVDGLGVGVGCVGLVHCGSRWVNGVLVDGLGVGVGCVGLVHCGSRWVNRLGVIHFQVGSPWWHWPHDLAREGLVRLLAINRLCVWSCGLKLLDMQVLGVDLLHLGSRRINGLLV